MFSKLAGSRQYTSNRNTSPKHRLVLCAYCPLPGPLPTSSQYNAKRNGECLDPLPAYSGVYRGQARATVRESVLRRPARRTAPRNPAEPGSGRRSPSHGRCGTLGVKPKPGTMTKSMKSTGMGLPLTGSRTPGPVVVIWWCRLLISTGSIAALVPADLGDDDGLPRLPALEGQGAVSTSGGVLRKSMTTRAAANSGLAATKLQAFRLFWMPVGLGSGRQAIHGDAYERPPYCSYHSLRPFSSPGLLEQRRQTKSMSAGTGGSTLDPTYRLSPPPAFRETLRVSWQCRLHSRGRLARSTFYRRLSSPV